MYTIGGYDAMDSYTFDNPENTKKLGLIIEKLLSHKAEDNSKGLSQYYEFRRYFTFEKWLEYMHKLDTHRAKTGHVPIAEIVSRLHMKTEVTQKLFDQLTTNNQGESMAKITVDSEVYAQAFNLFAEGFKKLAEQFATLNAEIDQAIEKGEIPAPVKEEIVPEQVVEPVKQEPTPPPIKVPDPETAMSIEDLKLECKKLGNSLITKNTARAKELISEFGASKFSEIKDADLPKFREALTLALAA